MNLKQEKEKILRKLYALIENGTKIRDQIEVEYSVKRSNGSLITEKDIPIWKERYASWYQDCQTVLQKDFDQPIIFLNRFRDACALGVPLHGAFEMWELDFWGIINHFKGKLSVLDDLLMAINGIQESELSDFVEITHVPGAPSPIIKVRINNLIPRIANWFRGLKR